MTTPTIQSRRGTAYATRCGNRVYVHVGPNGQVRHLNMTRQEAADLVTVLADVLGDEEGAGQ